MKDRSEYTRVTEILSTYSKLDMIPPDVLERACQRGTEVHAICEAHLTNMGVPPYDPELEGYIESFRKWHAKHVDVEFSFPERFFNDNLELSGECDCIMFDGDKVVLIDFKTSANESKTWALQGAAYVKLASANGLIIDEICFVKLSKDGSDAKVYTYEYLDNLTLFQKALDLHRYFNPAKRKKEKKENE